MSTDSPPVDRRAPQEKRDGTRAFLHTSDTDFKKTWGKTGGNDGKLDLSRPSTAGSRFRDELNTR